MPMTKEAWSAYLKRRRQRIREMGYCILCQVRKSTHYHQVCNPCHIKNMLRKRRKYGNNPWRPGGPGRPPKHPEITHAQTLTPAPRDASDNVLDAPGTTPDPVAAGQGATTHDRRFKRRPARDQGEAGCVPDQG